MDQGSQFTSTDFTDVLRDAKVKISPLAHAAMRCRAADGRARPLDPLSWFASKPLPGNGQPHDRAPLAVAEIRVRLPERVRNRLRGPQRDRCLDHLLQRKTPAFITWAAD